MISDEKLSYLLHEHTPEPPTFLQPESLMGARDRAPAVKARTTAWATSRFGLPRFAGAAIAVVVVTGVVAGSIAVAGRRHPATHPSPTAATSLPRPTTPANPVEAYLTVAATWLPPGTATVVNSSAGLAERAGRVDDLDYTIRRGSRTASLQIGLAPGTSLPAADPHGVPSQNLTIDGSPARQWSVASLSMVRILRGNTVVTVALDSTHTTAATVREWARHIAAGLRYDRHDRVRTAFGLGPLPDGLHPIEVSAGILTYPANGHTVTTSYTLSRDGAVNSVEVMVIPHGNLASANQPGRPVQGRPTYTSNSGGRPALRIDGAIDGQNIAVLADASGARGATLAQLYVIADGLVLHS